jgi:soluble lytic murein transglycosylase-like protein
LVSEAYAQTPDLNLESTPDANTTDQFIIDKAQELGNDPNAIIAFGRDEIGFESYKGSLGGVRGGYGARQGMPWTKRVC